MKVKGTYTKSSGGNFRLNQHASVFAHKSTKRLRSKQATKRDAVERSQRGE